MSNHDHAGVYAELSTLFQYKSGLYYSALGRANVTFAGLADNIYAVPFYVPAARAIDRIGLELTVAGEAGSKVRLGVYSNVATGNAAPNALLFDAGQIDGTVTGFGQITIAQTLPVGIVWLAAALQSCNTTRPTARMLGNGDSYSIVGSWDGLVGSAGYRGTSVAGALPATYPTIQTSNSQGPLVMVRFV